MEQINLRRRYIAAGELVEDTHLSSSKGCFGGEEEDKAELREILEAADELRGRREGEERAEGWELTTRLTPLLPQQEEDFHGFI